MSTPKLSHDGNWYVLLQNFVPPKEPTMLAPGLSVRPLKEPITVYDLALTRNAGFKGWTALEPFCKYCWAEIESAKDAEVLPGYDTLNRAWLLSALLVFRGFTPLKSVAFSAYSWNEIAGCRKRHEASLAKGNKFTVAPFKGGLLDFHLASMVDQAPNMNPLSQEDFRWMQENFERFNQLAAESVKFRFALEACMDWRFAKEPRSAVARLWSGIEAIFETKSELVYKISLWSASLLSPRGNERKGKFAAVKRLYGCRSKIVHGETMEEKEIYQVMSDSFYLLRDLIILCINKGHVLDAKDFEEAVFN